MGDTIRLRIKRYDGSGFDYKEVETREEADHWKRNYGAVEAPEQTAGEFASRATRSINPVEWARGVRDVAMDPLGAAQGIADVPVRLAGQAVDEFGKGNYAKAANKGVMAATPFAFGAAGALFGGLPGLAGGYLAGTGVAAGADEVGEQLEQGNYATAAGAGIDTAVQAMLGRRQMQGRPTPLPGEQAARYEQQAGNLSARTFGPTVGPDRYSWGQQARTLGPEMLRRTTSRSVGEMALELEGLRERANAGLDAAYDLIPRNNPMRTADVRRGLLTEIRRFTTRDRTGHLVPLEGYAERAGYLQQALQELDRLPASMPAAEIRKLRQSWDQLAEYENVPRSTVNWRELRAQGAAYRIARNVLNERTMQNYPDLLPQAADTTFAIGATDLLRVLEETENARSRIGRRLMTGAGGLTAGLVSGGAVTGAIGAVAGPVVEWALTEKLGPAAKIQTARTMANLAEEIRTNGQTPAAMRYARELQDIMMKTGRVGRAATAAESDERAQPLTMPIVSPEQAAASGVPVTSWFDSILERMPVRDPVTQQWKPGGLERDALRERRRGQDIELR